MPFTIAQPVRTETTRYVVFKDLYTRDECQTIIDYSKTMTAQPAQVGDGKEGTVDPTKRRTEIFWINWESTYNWLFSRMADSVAAANNKWWGYHLAGLNEALQLTHYKSEEQGFYDWHEDHADSGTMAHRKLSCVTLLSDGFEGGDFELLGSGKTSELSVGTMIMFPSFRTHRVLPVTKGERWSLVSWVSGPPFV